MTNNSLNDFDLATRKEALASLVKEEGFPPVRPFVNAHAHTFYSFNYKGYSPSRFVLEARREGLEMGGIVDFDVLDGLEEFWEASRLLDLKGCVGIESRVCSGIFRSRRPPGNGISYHMGTGFTTKIPEKRVFLDNMRTTSSERNQAMVQRVNEFSPLP